MTDATPWRSIDDAPRDGTPIWGKVDQDAIRMLWHPHFKAFVSSWREMTLAPGLRWEDGKTKHLHSPVVHEPKYWMPIPEDPEGAS